MLKRIFFLMLLLLFLVRAHTQVNLQTGSATFSLPMFNWQDDKSRLNSIVALSYSSGNGLKVNDVASNVGQGWNLVAGGVITRMQVGEPDDQVAAGGTDPADITKYPAGILYATIPAYNGCPNALSKYPLYKKQNQVYSQHNLIAEDKQLDYFTFQFNGKAGMFVLDPYDTGKCKSLGDTKMKITYQQDGSMINLGIRTKITAFTIQDVDGLTYKFSIHGLGKALAMGYCDVSLNQLQHLPKFRNLRVFQQTGIDNLPNPWIIYDWYLSEIDDPLTQRKILFNYATRMIIPAQNQPNAGTDFSYNSAKDYAVVIYKKSFTQNADISSIVYPDGHTVTFNYPLDRIDYVGEKALASVDITYFGRFLSKYLLNTTYIMRTRYGNPSNKSEIQSARLYLKSVQKIGPDLADDSPPYIFDYYLTATGAADDFVPPPFFYAKDIWGFYNGNKSVRYEDNLTVPLDVTVPQLLHDQIKGLCFWHSGVTGPYLNPNPGYAKTGLLRQIIYPTGGTLTYDYSQNSGVLPGQSLDQTLGGVHVNSTTSTDGGYSNGCTTNPLTTHYNYVMSDGLASSLWGIETPVNTKFTASHYAPFDQKYHWLDCLPFGCCYYKYFYPGIISEKESLDISTFQNIMNTIQPYLNILSMVGTIMDVATLIAATDPTFGTIAAVVIDVLSGLVQLITSCAANYSQDPSTTIYYNMDLNGISPLPGQYKRVEIIEGSGTIGKTVQTFTSGDDYTLWVGPNQNFAFAAKQRFAPWAYGLPRFTTVLDASGNKIKETENQYDTSLAKTLIDGCFKCSFFGSSGLTTPLVACKCDVTQSYSQRSTDWANASLYNNTYITTQGLNTDINVDYYGMYTGRLQLARSYERVFRTTDPNQVVETSTSYSYNNSNYEPNSISTIGSEGNTYTKDIKYTTDYTGGVITTLLSNNIVSLPVETTSSVFKGSGTQVLNEQVTEFTQLANGDIKPSRTLEQRFTQPQSTVTLYGGPGSSISNYKITQMLTYDASGNLIGLKDEGSRNVTNIYDYRDKYIIGTVINADPAIDNPAYSSFESTGFGGWSRSGPTPVYVPNSGITGSQAYNLNLNTFSRTLNTTKSYILSFWANNASVLVTPGTLVKSAPTYNGFTYYEYQINAGATSVSVSGNSIIDELRLYPKNARMRTVSYDEIIGKTSECDENNRITYYEYDKLGRLRFIKDETKNIVKMYEYNNVSLAKQNGCPGTYYNHFISETFTRNNCTAGSAGTNYTVTVAANTYSSTKSQADADAQAENWLFNNAQSTANTNGACLLIYQNASASRTFTTQCENEGFIGGSVVYTVPPGTYSSTISQADADQQAQDDIDANGQSYANDHGVCNVDTRADWEWPSGAQTTCRIVGGQVHQFIWATDVNPNSATYNFNNWMDAGVQASCSTGCTFSTAPGFGIATSSIANSNGVVSFSLTFFAQSTGTNYLNTNTVANISLGCRPSVGQQFNVVAGSRTWKVNISNIGTFNVQLISGSPPSPVTQSVTISGSYNN